MIQFKRDFLKMKRLQLLFILFGLSAPNLSKAQELPSELLINEYHVFEVPGLPLTGPAHLSWFFIRDSHFWNGAHAVNMKALPWPKWETKQIPVTLSPVSKQKSFLLLYDQNKKFLNQMPLDKPFNPREYEKKNKNIPGFYQVATLHAEGHLELRSPIYPWYQTKKIATCEVDTRAEKFDLKKDKRMALCVQTLKAYLSDDSGRQYYFILEKPALRGRANHSEYKSIERELRSLARKKGMVFLSRRASGRKIRAEVGATQIESLPQVGMDPSQFEEAVVLAEAQNTQKARDVIHDEKLENGSHLKVFGLYSDQTLERSITSPKLGNRKIHLQIVRPSPRSQNPNSLHAYQLRASEELTGLKGFFRAWQAHLFTNFNYLNSSRGESNYLLGAPGLDVQYNWEKLNLVPYLSFEKQLLHFGSSLQVSELKVGASYWLPWGTGWQANLGVVQYNLSGENPGATRLGDFTALSLGARAGQKIEDWRLKQSLDFLFGNAQSYELRVEAGKMFSRKADEALYFGVFLAYTEYQANVLNKINVQERIGESRLQLGLKLGWMGPDSF